jgi:hypothetical protein
MGDSRCIVTLLRPQGTSREDFLRGECLNKDFYNERIDQWLEFYRKEILGIAHEKSISLIMREYQIFHERPVMGRKRRRMIFEESDVLTTINPPDILLAFIQASVRNKSEMRAIIAYSDREEFEEAFPILGALQASSGEKKKYFAFLYHNEDAMRQSIEQVLIHTKDHHTL